MESKISNKDISLHDLLIVFLKEWKIIIAITGLMTVAAFMYLQMTTVTLYKSEMDISISVPSSVLTELGVYQYPSIYLKDYYGLLQLQDVAKATIEDLDLDMSTTEIISNISITHIPNTHKIHVSYTNTNPDEVTQILDTHIDNFINYTSNYLKKDALDSFLTNKSIELEIKETANSDLEKKINQTNLLLEDINEVILLKKIITSDAEIALNYSKSNDKNLESNVFYQEILNPSYTQTKGMLTGFLNQEIYNKIEIENLQDFIDEMTIDMEILSQATPAEKVETDLLKILDKTTTKLSQNSTEATMIPTNNTSRLIGVIILGLTVSIFVVIAKFLWINRSILFRRNNAI